MPASSILTQFDVPEMLRCYDCDDNYEILNFDSDSNRCVIYFSSNGLYYPSTSEVFNHQIIKGNRFEWKKNITPSAKKVIFLRDITKQWYLTGINARINTIEKLKSFLAKETAGMEVICVGSSAGGYAATLLGCMLNAKYILNFSGQYSLNYILEQPIGHAKNPTLSRYAEDVNYNCYYSIESLIATSSSSVFYFYPAKSSVDQYQANFVKGVSNVYEFAFNGRIHGKTCFVINLIELLTADQATLMNWYMTYQNRLISPTEFSIRLSGLPKTLYYLGWQLPNILVKKGIRASRARLPKASFLH
jgi:hypothetical protein